MEFLVHPAMLAHPNPQVVVLVSDKDDDTGSDDSCNVGTCWVGLAARVGFVGAAVVSEAFAFASASASV